VTPALVLLVGAVAGGVVYALARAADRIVRPVPKMPARSVHDTSLEYQEVSIESGDHSLAAWLLCPASSGHADTASGAEGEPSSLEWATARGSTRAPLFVLAHGWGASHGTVLQLAEPLARAGHEVLLFDLRGHGANRPARHVTVRDLRDDVMAVLRYASARAPRRPVVLVGHSFGGAASVLAAAEGARVSGLVLIATPADVVRITAEFLSDQGVPGTLATTVLRPFWWWRLGGTFRRHSPVRRVRELDVPLLLIQPEHDHRVRRHHAEMLSAAAGVPYRLVKGREHTDVLGAPETVRLVLEFAERLAAEAAAATPSDRSAARGAPTRGIPGSARSPGR
jgi:alpha-beta hydrolase superfamily lysophospholipase